MNIHLYLFLVMRTRDENKELTIREKALEMAVKDGFDGLSMQKLAKAAGVSPATIYIYFKDRDDLILQLWLQEVKKMVDATLEGFDPSMRFDEGLKIQWLNRAKFCMQNPTSMHFLEQIKYSPYHDAFSKKMDNTFLNSNEGICTSRHHQERSCKTSNRSILVYRICSAISTGKNAHVWSRNARRWGKIYTGR